MAATNKNRKVYIAAAIQTADMTQSDYEAATWVELGHVGNVGESGSKDNIVNYDELGTAVIQKNKGLTNAGDPVFECARKVDDAGQIIARACGRTHNTYAIKITDDDAPTGYLPTTYYNRGVLVGPVRPNGRNEAFNLEMYTMGCVQREIVVDPVPLSVPVSTSDPSITNSVASVPDASSGILTGIVGSYTFSPTSYVYVWEQDTAGNNTFVAIGGATSITYDPVVGSIGNKLRFGTKGVNAAGTSAAFAYSMPTAPVQA